MTFQSSSYGSLELTLDLDTLPIVAIRNATLRATAFWQLGSIMTQHIEENAHLQALLAAAVDAVITIDRLGIIQSCNPAAERIFGYSKDELLGQNISILMPSPFREEHDGYLANYAKTGDARIIGIGREAEAMRKDGSVFPADIAVSEFTTGNERFFTGFVRDISELKDAQERALQAERLAAIGQTVTGLAHESRNAFQRSQVCLEMLALDLEGQDDQLELVSRIQRALDHVHHLYEEVRDYAAPINLDRETCNLCYLWRDAWSHLEVNRQEKSVELKEVLTSESLDANVDFYAMGQVFRNILENAIAACPDPGEITIRDKNIVQGGNPTIQITIGDNGPGIDPATKERVFDAFFTTKTKGTGLGLAIVRRIVEAHGGAISLGDSESTGTEFIVTLPLGKA